MTDGSEWDMKIWLPEVEHVTRGRSPRVTSSTEGSPISMSHELPCVICFVVWPTRFPTRWRRFWEFYPQDGGVENLPTRWRQCRVFESFTHKMAAWEFCLQNGGVSESFTHKMAAWEFCLQDGGISESLEYILRLQWRIYLVNVTWP